MKKIITVISIMVVFLAVNFGYGQKNASINLLAGVIQEDGLPKGWITAADNSDCIIKFQSGAIYFERQSPDEKCSFAFSRDAENGDYLLESVFEIDGNGYEIFLDGAPLQKQNQIKVSDGRLRVGIQTKGDGKVWGNIFKMTATKTSEYKIEETQTFKPPTEKKVLLFSKNKQSNKLILFYSKLRVNTDGSPRSYHPDDFDGTNVAINTLCNGIAVYQVKHNGTRIKKLKKCSEKSVVFKKFKANNWVNPAGYEIVWQNVIAQRTGKPCIFRTNESGAKGYFGSLTSAKNGLSGTSGGECEYKNQLDAVTIPNLVLPAEKWKDSNKVIHINPLYTFEAKKGDFVFAYNEANSVWSYAVIGDGGPSDNLGEGSVALNMKLKQVTSIPTNYKQAKELDTGTNKIFIAIIPNSSNNTLKPYTAEKIEIRGKQLIREMGFEDEQSFISFILKQKTKL